MEGRVLREKDITGLEYYVRVEQNEYEVWGRATVAIRFATVRGWQNANKQLHAMGHRYLDKIERLSQQNTIMREALDEALTFTKSHVIGTEGWYSERDYVRAKIEDALAKIKSNGASE